MKYLMSICWICLCLAQAQAQITVGQVDDFEDGTEQDWEDGGSGSNSEPVNIATGGPDGANDNYLSNTALGGTGEGSRMVMFNSAQWGGAYTAAGVQSISFDARAITNDLTIRIAMDGDGGRICTQTAVPLVAGADWDTYAISITPDSFVLVDGGTNIEQTLADVSTLRILSNPTPAWRGEAIMATLDMDNITASSTLGVASATAIPLVELKSNVVTTDLEIHLRSTVNQSVTVSVFNVLGQLVMGKEFNPTQWHRIPMETLQSGIYLLQVVSGHQTVTKRFMKK